jgi:hypothetical protein
MQGQRQREQLKLKSNKSSRIVVEYKSGRKEIHAVNPKDLSKEILKFEKFPTVKSVRLLKRGETL